MAMKRYSQCILPRQVVNKQQRHPVTSHLLCCETGHLADQRFFVAMLGEITVRTCLTITSQLVWTER
jgi:hypothetical protein